jgi:hypothetical protein
MAAHIIHRQVYFLYRINIVNNTIINQGPQNAGYSSAYQVHVKVWVKDNKDGCWIDNAGKWLRKCCYKDESDLIGGCSKRFTRAEGKETVAKEKTGEE